MNNLELEKILNGLLKIHEFQDYTPNGLQVEGCFNISKIVTGVTACQVLLEIAVEKKADTIIVHHGYFWKNESSIINGIKKIRLRTLLINNINLYSYHLPLDVHYELGNNNQLSYIIGVKVYGQINQFISYGFFKEAITADMLNTRLETRLHRKILYCTGNNERKIQKVAWCTGNGQDFIYEAARFGVDAFITGGISEQSVHIAREMKIHFYSAGHHATERYGIKKLSEWLIDKYDLDVEFVDIDNIA
ncbi:Putative GTP cyclohydrolase 1 type 2 [Candidatus Providencia siddallii]|uniref:GTP cyclohydrolase 1 type 2 homolog n=1 Tax=Candidatus Providencia siddallii TaxID=1715285 RepID=A0A0M6W997_9GAMM|nr:Putative GTP cyclohydrolase 1 type 2 [Candidatus Providencia siddallii]